MSAAGPAETPQRSAGPAFSVEIDPVMLYGPGYVSTTTTPPLPPRVSRREAMSVPAVKRSRDIIAGTLGTLPIELIGPDNTTTDWSLFDQPETDVPCSVTKIMTFEDLLFEQVAWWKIEYVGWHGKPVTVRRLDPRTVTVTDGKVYVAGKYTPDSRLIRFDGPNDALLVAGARAIRAAMSLDAAALRNADGTPPMDYFAPKDNSVDPTPDEVVKLLNDWAAAKRTRATSYVPGALDYQITGWSPEQLQLAAARQHAVLELARLAGVDPEDLGVSTTSRTYFNAFDRKQHRIQDTLRAYIAAFEDRLSMNDVSPRGYRARLNLSDFLRSDDLTRMQVHDIALRINAETEDEMRAAENKPALTAEERALPAAPAQEPSNA
jgi:hypothetical protein